MKKFLAGMMYQRMLNLAEFEQNEVFREIYVEALRKAQKELISQNDNAVDACVASCC